MLHLCLDTSGYVIHWHYVTGQKLSYVHEKDNQLLSIAYDKEGMQFATGGSDNTVRVYDILNNQLKAKLKYGYVSVFDSSCSNGETSGHSQRIFCVKFHPTDSNLLISSGWDNTIQVILLSMAHLKSFGTFDNQLLFVPFMVLIFVVNLSTLILQGNVF
jgi:WD40 repeat protein